MNELLEQFLSEARDALEGIGTKLMELERAPQDVELMTQLFRLVHTLKGNSGLFDFPEMTRVLHAGEDLMDAVRHERIGYSETLADRLLDAMDFIGRLCDGIESNQPPDSSMATEAVRLAAGLRQLVTPESHNEAAEAPAPASSSTSPVPAMPSAAELLQIPESLRLQAWQRAQDGEPVLWVRYQPAEECFFQGEDPLHQAKLTPGLLWGGMQARAPWPPLTDIDAYQCQLNFGLLVLGHRSDIETHFRYVPEQIEILPTPALCLALPVGDPNGGPVYEDFVADALQFVQARDSAGLARTVRLMLELSNSSLWLASGLRWLDTLLQSAAPDWQALQALVLSIRTLQAPDWHAFIQQQADNADVVLAGAPAAPTTTASAMAAPLPTQEALHSLLTVQREVLALPDNDAWLSGRLKAVSSALAACLRATGRLAEITSLEAATSAALEQGQALPLAQWLETAFAAPETATVVSTGVNSSAPAPVATPTTPTPAPAAETPPADLGSTESKMGRRSDDHLSPKSLKVDQVKIDRLMNLIGEMVVAKNAIPYLANRAENQYGVRELAREIKAQYAVINRISEEMQDAIMQVRMMPVSFIFQRFPRLVRDTSRHLGKDINLVLEGQDTAADKNIIEAMGDPLIHLVRNSMDHGLELPEVRLAAGKPAQGTLKIIARQEADRVLIEISDDGKGIDPTVMKRKAYEKGLIDEATLERITDQEAINLIFLAGFSTAEVVSELSGRGVGMDVVRTAINRVNGAIALESVLGQGTRIRLSLPLSMAVSNVMTIEADGQIFGVPMDKVVETVRVPRLAVREIKQGLVTVLRGRVVPLKSLNRLLGLAPPPLCNSNDEYAVLVVRVGEATLGLLVDNFHETADIILKPLSGVLAGLSMYSGSALMGDGSVLMVLNIQEML
jgi:two-component system, chemotaxis family, sensor kinase CheA